MQFVGENHGVSFYNDSKATNPHAAIQAVEAFQSVVLVAGGLNKGLDLSALRRVAPRLRSVVAFGAARDEIVRAFDNIVPVVAVASMREAVLRSWHDAVSGDVVLLSPGCASFDMYPGGYPERGDDFAREVRCLMAEEGV